MKIQDFGFEPVVGKEYVVTFTKDGELLSTSVYNGSPLPAVNFPDNAKVGFTVTDKETGKQLMSTDFVSYNGKLYKAVFNLPLQNPDTNKNANIYIKDLHYDLTTGSVLVQVQGFSGDNYKLVVADSTLKHKVMSMPIVLQDDMFYSIPTELVQNNKFEVTLQDQHGKTIDMQEFVAPISTDWRYTDTVENGTLELDEQPVAEEQPTDTVPPVEQLQIDQTQNTTQTQQATTEASSILPEPLAKYEKPIFVGCGILLAILLAVLIARLIKRRKAKQAWESDSEETFEEVEEQEEGYEEEEQEHNLLDPEPEFEDVTEEPDPKKRK